MAAAVAPNGLHRLVWHHRTQPRLMARDVLFEHVPRHESRLGAVVPDEPV